MRMVLQKRRVNLFQYRKCDFMAYKKKTKRVLSDEHIAKMQEGRKNAQKQREEKAKTKERVAMLSDLDKRLAIGRKNAESDSIKIRTRHRKRKY